GYARENCGGEWGGSADFQQSDQGFWRKVYPMGARSDGIYYWDSYVLFGRFCDNGAACFYGGRCDKTSYAFRRSAYVVGAVGHPWLSTPASGSHRAGRGLWGGSGTYYDIRDHRGYSGHYTGRSYFFFHLKKIQT